MEHSFNVELAKKYGILEAILLNNLWNWIKKNEANNKHFYNGKYWTYNSIKAFSQLFPYANERQIKYALKKLKDLGLIISDKFNKSGYDKTLWYAFTPQGISIVQNCPIDSTKLSNREDTIVQPIPYINTYKENIFNSKELNIKESEQKKQKFGTYQRVLLTQNEYDKLCNDFTKEFIDKQIELLDEYVESNNNKNGYKNFNLVLRKSIREEWFKSKLKPKIENEYDFLN